MSEDIEVEAVEATVVEDAPDIQTTALVRRERRSEVLRPLDADQLSASFKEYQALLPKLLEGSDYQDAGYDKQTQKPRRFVKKSGWRKIATAFDLDVILVTNEVDRDESGHVIRAKVIARAIAPSGRTMDGDGYCSIDEARFNGSRADLSKVENDLRGTATTRAKNRAISDLVGMGDVSAEEMSDPPGVSAMVVLPFGPVMAEEVSQATGAAVIKIAGGDREAGTALWHKIRTRFGGAMMPQAAALALIEAADALTAVPWDPEYVEVEVKPVDRDAGSKPLEAQSDDDATDLEAAAYDAWRRAGAMEQEAVKLVKDANGEPKALWTLIDAAEQLAAKKAKVTSNA